MCLGRFTRENGITRPVQTNAIRGTIHPAVYSHGTRRQLLTNGSMSRDGIIPPHEMRELPLVRIREIEINPDVSPTKQLGFDRHTNHVLFGMADGTYFHFLPIQLKTTIDNSCPKINLLSG